MYIHTQISGQQHQHPLLPLLFLHFSRLTLFSSDFSSSSWGLLLSTRWHFNHHYEGGWVSVSGRGMNTHCHYQTLSHTYWHHLPLLLLSGMLLYMSYLPCSSHMPGLFAGIKFKVCQRFACPSPLSFSSFFFLFLSPFFFCCPTVAPICVSVCVCERKQLQIK